VYQGPVKRTNSDVPPKAGNSYISQSNRALREPREAPTDQIKPRVYNNEQWMFPFFCGEWDVGIPLVRS